MSEKILLGYDPGTGDVNVIAGSDRMAIIAERNGGFVPRRMVEVMGECRNAALPERFWVQDPPPSVASTLKLVRAIHDDEVDWAGQPYVNHSIGVMHLLPFDADEEEKMLALLHGSLEHGQLTAEELRRRGYSRDFIRRLELLTNGPTVKGFDAFMQKICQIADSGDVRCIRVKIADCAHNIFHVKNNYVEPLRVLLDGLRRSKLGNLVESQ